MPIQSNSLSFAFPWLFYNDRKEEEPRVKKLSEDYYYIFKVDFLRENIVDDIASVCSRVYSSVSLDDDKKVGCIMIYDLPKRKIQGLEEILK